MTLDYDALAKKHGFSRSAVEAATQALQRGTGNQAQFNHPELGGMGQWQPGMMMIGNMFDTALKARVDGLFSDLAGQVSATSLSSMPPLSSARWWPAEFGDATATGSQNDLRYAWFAGARRLLIRRGTALTAYDTGAHRITGVSQQQNNASQDLRFQTQSGSISLSDLKQVTLD